MINIIIQVIIPLAMFSLMFSMGLTLRRADFQRVLVFPKATLIALLLQLLIVPAIGFALAYGFELPTMMAVGLVAVAACPGGTTSNLVVHLGKGDVALSITITATATVITLFTLPLWVNYSLTFFGGDQVSVEMPIVRTAAQIALFTVVPVGLGMFARKVKEELLRWESLLTKLSTITIIAAFVVMNLGEGLDNSTAAFIVIIPASLLVLLAILTGFLVPYSLGVSKQDSATIAVETCLKNVLLSLFLASTVLNDMEASYASVMVMTIMMPLAALIMVAYNLSNKIKLKQQVS